jgi:hypothetical protein
MLPAVDVTLPAPCARAKYVALQTDPPIPGASTVMPGLNPASVNVICAVR